MVDQSRTNPSNLADADSVSEREKTLQLRAAQDRRVIMELLSQPIGRNWMWSILQQCHLLSLSFSPEPQIAAFREGERNIGLLLWSQIERHAPELGAKMIAEKGDARG